MDSVFWDFTVWIRYLGILLSGFGIKGFYCGDSVFMDSTVWIRYLGILLYGFWVP